MNETLETSDIPREGATTECGGNVAVAVIAALLLGPFGMFYSTRVGAIVMIVLTVLIALPTLGFGVVITLPLCMVWAGIAALSNERRSLASAA